MKKIYLSLGLLTKASLLKAGLRANNASAFAAKAFVLSLFSMFLMSHQVFATYGDVGDRVWNDLNKNGVQDNGEPGLSGVKVTLTKTDGSTVSSDVTDGNGIYGFTHILAGKYILVFTTPSGYTPTTSNVGDPTKDSDPVNGKVNITIYAGETNPCIDAGYWLTPTTQHYVGQFIWKDLNCNGLQDAGEPGIPNVKVTITYPNGTTTATTYSDANGKYYFYNLPVGTYSFTFYTPAGYTPAPANANNNNSPTIDSDPVNGKVSVTVYAGEDNPCIDAGYCNAPAQKHNLGNLVWNDRDGDGLRDANEPGISGVDVYLYKDANSDNKPDGAAIATTTTSSNGSYNFGNLLDGRYIVGIEAVNGYILGGSSTGSNPDNDVDNDNNAINTVVVNGAATEYRTNAITLTTGGEPTNGNDNYTLDLALRGTAAVGDFVWKDLNCNGIQDSGEPGISGVKVTITFADGTSTSTTTDANGKYFFYNLGPGNVVITFTTPAGYHASPADVNNNNDPTTDSDPINGSVTVTVYAGETNPCIDAGFCQDAGTAVIGDFVWNDLNGNNVQDAGEPGIPGVKVTLTFPDNTTQTTTTDANGAYHFYNLPAGTYNVCFQTPTIANTPFPAWIPRKANVGGDDTKDSDPVNGCVTVTLTTGQVNNTIDAGYSRDIDDDNDGIINIVEGHGYDGLGDCDGDGIPNYLDPTPGCSTTPGNDIYGKPYKPLTWTDCNNDGVNDFFDFDKDGIIDQLDLDSDNDGILDNREARDSKMVDANNDGMIDGSDADLDGLLSTADANDNVYGGPGLTPEDMDRDGLPNYTDLDSDGDGITDLNEATGVFNGFDTDGIVNGTDTDKDGVNSTADNVSGFGARGITTLDTDNDGKPNPYDIDSDNDGITDNVEGQPTCSEKQPTGVDTDKDGLDDAYDIDNNLCVPRGGGITPYDKDGDGTPDIYDLDTDNDGAPDVNEGSGIYGNFVTNFADTDGDGLIDQFDIFNIKTATSLFINNVAHSNMGPNGNFNGPVPAGSSAKLPQSQQGSCPAVDRDWRNVTILPFTMLDFKGNLNNGSTKLTWSTTNEVNMVSYIVERSTDGINYTAIATVKATGNATSVTNYSYIDNLAGLSATNVYYRLQQVDRSQAAKLSNTLVFKLNGRNDIAMTVHPNPASDFFILKVEAVKDGSALTRVMDVTGKVLLSQNNRVAAGSNAITFNAISKMASGTYNVQVILDGQVFNQKLVIVK